MNATIKEVSIPMGKDIAKKAYQVNYGNPDASITRTFGVYEQYEMAAFVRFCIQNGSIIP